MSAEKYKLKPCPTCGCEMRYASNHKCVDCCLRLARIQKEKTKEIRKQAPVIREKTSYQKAKDAGDLTYEGKLCKCGSRIRYTTNCNCVMCINKKKKEAKKKVIAPEPIKPKLGLSNMAWC